ncbi:hypothetical protein L596_012148 [Steinernema carpocapsae]|nr:hypothetical protein L596_012148 [Steinernema carpocapsae]
MSLLASTSSEPQMSEDVIAIGQREMMRYRANVNKERHVKPILKSSTCSSKTASASASETEKKDNELSVVRSIYLTGVHFERKKKKGVTFQHRNVETTIDTDVQNPNLLQKLKKPGQIRALGLTMLPVIFFKSTHAAPPPPPKK